MISPHRALDCAPLDVSASTRLSDSELARVRSLQQVLLRPLDHASVDAWRKAVNRTLRDVFASDAAMFQLDLEGVSLQYSEEFDPADTGEYVEELMPRFALKRRMYGRALERRAGNRSILWGEHLEWLYGSEYFNDLVRRMRAFDPLWVAAPLAGARYPAMLHTYHDRRRTSGFFDAADVTLMKVLQPALEAGVRAVARMAASRACLTAAFDERRDGTLVLDSDGVLLHRSPSLTRLARTRRTEEDLVGAARGMAKAMSSADAGAVLDARHASRTVSTRSGEYRLGAVLLGEGTFTPGRAILVSVTSGESPLPTPGQVRERFGLTPRQAEVALLLARRRTNPEIAQELCVSEHTVRSHAEAVMGRLGLGDRRAIRSKLTGS